MDVGDTAALAGARSLPSARSTVAMPISRVTAARIVRDGVRLIPVLPLMVWPRQS
jgi:hypothetical protein